MRMPSCWMMSLSDGIIFEIDIFVDPHSKTPSINGFGRLFWFDLIDVKAWDRCRIAVEWVYTIVDMAA